MSTTSEHEGDHIRRLQLLHRGVRRLESAGREAPRRTVEWLLTEALDCDRASLYVRPNETVPPDLVRHFFDMVDRCASGEPLQHVLGYTSFRGLRIDVSSSVMVPRPETEQVVEVALQQVASVSSPRVLDIGTGSGCIALAVKSERPDAAVVGWDVSADALEVARANADRLALDVSFNEVDLFSPSVANRDMAPVDLLVSNPPYIPRAEANTLPSVVRKYDPDVALFSGEDPLRFYRALAKRVPALCTPGAALVLETHAEYAEQVTGVARDAGLTNVEVRKDLSGRPRILSARYPKEEDRD